MIRSIWSSEVQQNRIEPCMEFGAEAMTLDGEAVGGVKDEEYIQKVKPSGDASTVTFKRRFQQYALLGAVGGGIARR